MNAEFLHLETLSWKLCGFNFSNCIVRDSCCPPNMRAWKIVFQLCFIILKKFLTFKKHCCFIYRQQKEAFYEFAFNFYSSIDWGLLTNKYYAQLGKIKNMCSTLKGPAVKGKSPPSTKNDRTMVHIFCAAKWLCTCNRSPARSRSSHYSHYCDESSLGGIQLHHGTGPASSVSCYDGARVLCGVASLCFSQDSPVLFFWKLNGSSMSWLLAHIRSYFMHYKNQNHSITTCLFQTTDKWDLCRTIQIKSMKFIYAF